MGTNIAWAGKLGAGHLGIFTLVCFFELNVTSGTNFVDGEEVAIKLESVQTEHPQLQYESKLYKLLQGGGMIACESLNDVVVGIPNLKWFGVEGDFNVMVMELLGPSLEDLFNFCTRKFGVKTVLLLADQMVWFDILSVTHVFRSVALSIFIREIFCIATSSPIIL